MRGIAHRPIPKHIKDSVWIAFLSCRHYPKGLIPLKMPGYHSDNHGIFRPPMSPSHSARVLPPRFSSFSPLLIGSL